MPRVIASLALVGVVSVTAAIRAGAQPVYPHLRLVAPAAPGGGWDQTARAMQQALQRAGIVRSASVENIPGAAGTIGLARFISAENGQGDTAMISGLIMVSAIVTHRSAVTMEQVTLIARLTAEYEVIVVPAASPFRSLRDLIEAFRKRPESISWGGGSAGGSDQILAGLIADAVGVSPRRVNYIAFSGGGEAMSAILGGQVSVGINGLAEFAAQIEAGTVRVLGISSGERLPGLDAPTLREQGVDLAFENWRCIVAPPNISDADRTRLDRAVAAMVHSPEWRDTLERYRWLDRYLAGDEFARFVKVEQARVRGILDQLGLGTGETSGAVPIRAYPALVLAGLVFCGGAAGLEVFRAARRKPAPASVPAAGRAPAWRAVRLIAAGMVIDVLLLERAGFVVASAALFWCTARAFSDQHPLRDVALAITASTGVYVLFDRALSLPLPAGPVGWLF